MHVGDHQEDAQVLHDRRRVRTEAAGARGETKEICAKLGTFLECMAKQEGLFVALHGTITGTKPPVDCWPTQPCAQNELGPSRPAFLRVSNTANRIITLLSMRVRAGCGITPKTAEPKRLTAPSELRHEASHARAVLALPPLPLRLDKTNIHREESPPTANST